MDCIFCKIINKDIPAKIIYEDEKTISFMDLNPNSEGHVLVIPKKHCSDFLDANEEDIINVAKTKNKVTKLLKDKLNPEGFNFVSNLGSIAHQVIFHYHEHIIPKYNKDYGYYPDKKIDLKMKSIQEIYNKIIK